MTSANLLIAKQKVSVAHSAHDYVMTSPSPSRRRAITPQQSRSIDFDENLLATDGISETAAWRKKDQRSQWNLADAETFPHSTGLAGASPMYAQETEKCASRRLPR
jgi:hypothetical protein